VVCVSRLRERISLVIWVSQVGEQISLVICVSSLGTHITSDTCFQARGTHITSDMGSKSRAVLKQLSMATIPLCFEFFRCRVDVLQSYFSRSSISFAEFDVSTQCLYLLTRSSVEPMLCGIFICDPLQFKFP